jgi:hypothetical protein
MELNLVNVVIALLALVGVIGLTVLAVKHFKGMVIGLGILLVIGVISSSILVPLWGKYHIQEVVGVTTERSELIYTQKWGGDRNNDVVILENGMWVEIKGVPMPKIVYVETEKPMLQYKKVVGKTWFGYRTMYVELEIQVRDFGQIPWR